MKRNLITPRLTNSPCLTRKAPVFPADQYQRLIGEGDPFRAPKRHARRKKPRAPRRSCGSRSTFPDDWNGVIVVAYHPTFHEMRRMEQHPGEFVGVMTGEAYTLLTSHILQKDRLALGEVHQGQPGPLVRSTQRDGSATGRSATASNSLTG